LVLKSGGNRRIIEKKKSGNVSDAGAHKNGAGIISSRGIACGSKSGNGISVAWPLSSGAVGVMTSAA